MRRAAGRSIRDRGNRQNKRTPNKTEEPHPEREDGNEARLAMALSRLTMTLSRSAPVGLVQVDGHIN
jgi:hypothetical protein